MRKIDQAIITSFNLRTTLETVLAQVISQLQVDAAKVLLLNPEEQVLEYAAGKGFRSTVAEAARVPLGKSLAGRAAKERRLVTVENLKDHPDDPLLAALLESEG